MFKYSKKLCLLLFGLLLCKGIVASNKTDTTQQEMEKILAVQKKLEESKKRENDLQKGTLGTNLSQEAKNIQEEEQNKIEEELKNKWNIPLLPENLAVLLDDELLDLYNAYDKFGEEENKNKITSELCERIKKNPLVLAEIMKQKDVSHDSALFNYSIFNYIKQNPNLFINLLYDTHIDEMVETEYIDEENIALKFREQSCRTNFANRGLSWKHDIGYVYKIYNPKQFSFIDFELCAMKINSNAKKKLLWGNKAGEPSTLSIFELTDNTINEITEGPLKEILTTTTTEKHGEYYTTLEDIIDEETYITIENNRILKLHHKNQQETFSIYKPGNLYSDKNKYIVEYEGHPTVLSYDYLSMEFSLIKLNDVLDFVAGNLLRSVIQNNKLHVLYKRNNKNYIEIFEIVPLEEQAILNDSLKINIYYLENNPKTNPQVSTFTISEFLFLTLTERNRFKLIYNNSGAGIKEAFTGDRIISQIPLFISGDWFWLTLPEGNIVKNYLFLKDRFVNSFLLLAQSNEQEKGRRLYEKFVSPGLPIPKISVSSRIKSFFTQVNNDPKKKNTFTVLGMLFGAIGTYSILNWYQNKHKK